MLYDRDYEQVQAMRRSWVPRETPTGDPRRASLMQGVEDEVDTPSVRSPIIGDGGVTYQQCGGGVRVMRKRITG